MQTFESLPPNLPVPRDDGACDHLLGKSLPSCALASTHGNVVNLAALKGWLVVYCYPMTGKPGIALPPGWDDIPGARGCTPQSSSFSDHYQQLKQLDAQVFGLSMQTTEYQLEAAHRLHLHFALLSDMHGHFSDALGLPTFEMDKTRLNKRVTLIAYDAVIQHYFYPVFPPDQNAGEVLAWLAQHSGQLGDQPLPIA